MNEEKIKELKRPNRREYREDIQWKMDRKKKTDGRKRCGGYT
jgi:hypothetical protein